MGKHFAALYIASVASFEAARAKIGYGFSIPRGCDPQRSVRKAALCNMEIGSGLDELERTSVAACVATPFVTVTNATFLLWEVDTFLSLHRGCSAHGLYAVEGCI